MHNQTQEKLGLQRSKTNFQSPRLNNRDFVYRKELIETELLGSKDHQFIFMEAQAGQGKTTTALQFMEKVKNPFCWYQIEEKDRDPLFLFLSVISRIELTLLDKTLTTGKLLRSGEVSQSNLSWSINQLMEELKSLSLTPSYLIFDDLHLLLDSPESLTLIDSLLELAIDPLSFILLTREPVPLKSKKVKFGSSTLYLTNQDLAFSLHETIELFSSKSNGSPISYEKATTLHTMTEGWVMGMILGEKSISLKGIASKRSDLDYRNANKLNRFFRKEIINSLPNDLRIQLLRLSLLDDIPVPLALEISGEDDFAEKLYDLMEQNRFIRLIDNDVDTFSFHHLMRETLRSEIAMRLGDKENEVILRAALNFHITRGEIEKSIGYALRLGNLKDVELILEQYGLELVSRNRYTTLQRIPLEIDAKERQKSGWIQLFEGILLSEKNPEKSLVHLRLSAQLFSERKCDHGRIIAVSQLIYHYILTALGSTSRCMAYLQECSEGLPALEKSLPLCSKMFIYRNIGAGYAVFVSEMKNSRLYLRKAVSYAREANISSIEVSSLIFVGYSYLLTGDYTSTMSIAESLYKSMLNEDIGIASTVIVQHFLTDILEVIDDYPNYQRHRDNYCLGEGKEILRNNHFGPSVVLWDIKLHIARDELNQAQTLIEEGLNAGSVFDSPHIKSRFLEYKAYVASLSNHTDTDIEGCLELAENLRNLSSWQGFFKVRNLLLSGISYGIAGQSQKADSLISEGIHQAAQLELVTIRASGYLFRAYYSMLERKESSVHQDIRSGLALMKKNGIDMFWGWHPKIMHTVLSTAVEEEIEPVFSRALLRGRLGFDITSKDDIVPLLEVNFFDGLKLAFTGRVVAEGRDLTPKQRDLLGLIISTPHLQMYQERIQTELWPDVSIEKARRNLDTLISRLRSFLRPLLKPQDINDYLVVRRGMVFLQYCKVDSHDFQECIKKGKVHVTKENWWQAGNNFYLAHQLWPDGGRVDLTSNDTVYSYLLELKNIFMQTCILWGKKLLEKGQNVSAQMVLETAWKTEPTNKDITTLLYKYYIHTNDPGKAASLLQGFRKALLKIDVCESDIDELLFSFTAI